MESRMIVLTGELGSGKTTVCAQLVSLFRKSGTDIAGIVSPPRFEKGVKTGIYVQDIRTQKQRLLAERANVGEGTANLSWRFDPSNMQWGTEILQTATPCEVLVIDELGPLELNQGQGWSIAFDILKAGNYQKALVVVRPSLISKFQTRVEGLPFTCFPVTPQNRTLIRNNLIVELVVESPQSLSDR